MANYEAINMAELVEEVERLASAGTSDFLDNFVRMPEKDGFVTVRLLPPGKGKKFYCATRTHRINNKSIHCPRELVRDANGRKRWVDPDPKKPCVICKYYSELWKEAEKKEGKAAEDLKNQARAIKPLERYYYNCIVRSQVNKQGEVEKNVGPKILSIGVTLHERILRAILGDAANDEKPLGDVTNIKEGRDFKVIKKIRGSGRDAFPNYDDSKFLDSSPLGEKDQVEKWFDNLHDLAALRVLKPAEEMKVELKKHLGLIQDESTGFDLSEFQKKPESIEDQVRQTQKTEKTEAPASAPVSTPEPEPEPVSGDAALAEQDFLDELRNLQ